MNFDPVEWEVFWGEFYKGVVELLVTGIWILYQSPQKRERKIPFLLWKASAVQQLLGYIHRKNEMGLSIYFLLFNIYIINDHVSHKKIYFVMLKKKMGSHWVDKWCCHKYPSTFINQHLTTRARKGRVSLSDVGGLLFLLKVAYSFLFITMISLLYLYLLKALSISRSISLQAEEVIF